jgi:GxxExxY protein
MTHIIHKELSYTVRGALIDVYNKLGPSLPESFYQEAVTCALEERGITCIPEKPFEVFYRNQSAGKYAIDHWLEKGKIILELKVAPQIMPIHQAQTLSYLKLTQADLAIIVNFGSKSLQDKRLPNFFKEKIARFQWQPIPLAEDTLYPELTNRLFEALHRVYFALGTGFIHRVYRQAMMVELKHHGLNYEKIYKIPVYYNQRFIGMQGTQMLQIENKIVMGVFAVKVMTETMQENMKARLRRLRMRLGILANFYGEKLGVTVVRNE